MKFKTYSSEENRIRKAIRKERTNNRNLQTERGGYETNNQESFFSSKKKAAR